MRLPSGGLGRGRPLASANAADGTRVEGTRAVLRIGEREIPWERIERADWNSEAETLTVAELGSYGQERPIHVLQFGEPARLLQLIRERVTASILLQRRVPVYGSRGLVVIGRRAPLGATDVQWFVEYDEGVDPADPAVVRAAESALAQARGDVGLG